MTKSEVTEHQEGYKNIENYSLLLKDNTILSSLEITLTKLMEIYNIAGLSFAIINDFNVVESKGFGVIDKNTNIPVTPRTLFQAGSISKPVTASVALYLVDQGILTLDDNINTKLVSWSIPENEFTQNEKVTLRRILSHTAGLTVHGFPGYTVNDQIPSLIQVLNGEQPANTPAVRVHAIPGSKWEYSGGGYTIVQQLLEDLLQKPFPELMSDIVFKNLHMLNSTFEQHLPPNLLPFAAHGSTITGEKILGDWHIYPEMAAAGLWSTPTDLANFVIELALSKHGKSNKLLSQFMTNEMFSSKFNSDENLDQMGLGFILGNKNHAGTFYHGGDDAGFQSILIMDSDSGKGAVIMCNSDFGYFINDFVLQIIAEHYKWTNTDLLNPLFIVYSTFLYEVLNQRGINFVLTNYNNLVQIVESYYKPNQDSLIYFSQVLTSKEKLKEASEFLKLQVSLFPSFWKSYNALGETYLKLGDNKLSLDNFKNALELDPNNALVLSNLQKDEI